MKAYIHPQASDALRETLKELLDAAGCEVVDDLEECEIDLSAAPPVEGEVENARDDEAGGEEPSEEEAEDDGIPPACIVILVPELTEEDLEPELSAAIGKGCRVIGIWGPGADGDISPLKDYGADTVPWDVERVRDAVCGTPQHQDPMGNPTPTPTPTTGGC